MQAAYVAFDRHGREGPRLSSQPGWRGSLYPQLYPFYRLQEDGYEPVVAGPELHRYQMVMHEVKPGWTITKEWEGYTIQSTIAFRDIIPEAYDGIFFSGGRAPEYIRYDEDLVRVTRHFFEAGKPIASVCHGVEIPAYADCVKGRRMATVEKFASASICGRKSVWISSLTPAPNSTCTVSVSRAGESGVFSAAVPMASIKCLTSDRDGGHKVCAYLRLSLGSTPVNWPLSCRT
jgi:protease I